VLIRLAHSPDPDDAFMFYGLSSAGRPGPYRFEHHLEDIQTLNERARRGSLRLRRSAFMRIRTCASGMR